MSILLLPFKIVFLIVAFILKGVLYLLAFILNFISYRLARRCIDRLFMAHIHGFQHDVLFKQCGG